MGDERIDVSDRVNGSRYRRVMNVAALSADEKAYLQGLYFADGYLRRSSKSTFSLEFFLQGNEGEIALKVAVMLSRCGLSPRFYSRSNGNMIDVWVEGKNILSLVPEKEWFLRMGPEDWKGWFSRMGLYGKLSVPFIAGLVDGDGYCMAEYERRDVFGGAKTIWVFSQVAFPYLVDFVGEYVHRLAEDGATTFSVGNPRRRCVNILASGRRALLEIGIRRWSSRVVWCVSRVQEIERMIADLRGRFLKVGEAARRLRVAHYTIRRWCKEGYVKHLRICGKRARGSNGHYGYIIPVEEVERLVGQLRQTWEMKNSGFRLSDLARELGIPQSRLYRLLKWRAFKATLVRDGRSNCWVIPRNEVEHLRRELDRS